uniref:Uncharacterized protein n=1 Tax=Chromera velia CCMP2878 TaxID=1169474 RepID=A0A0G4I390_9ALVE|eukprot:Cvel_10568.t1-p1 / transcript=Cvel_10568.t1 / gene=Cvel_10568 / organism=Chromera_velia_CCMP2878 / gene_product=hypothetical protein / transcript_product=hypothetical protein / location=Cvel_scaffold640:18110-36949(-) / protein_length=1556 / sequence_SO=supercontig / SO=protein_coding / is_pseudo=false
MIARQSYAASHFFPLVRSDWNSSLFGQMERVALVAKFGPETLLRSLMEWEGAKDDDETKEPGPIASLGVVKAAVCPTSIYSMSLFPLRKWKAAVASPSSEAEVGRWIEGENVESPRGNPFNDFSSWDHRSESAYGRALWGEDTLRRGLVQEASQEEYRLRLQLLKETGFFRDFPTGRKQERGEGLVPPHRDMSYEESALWREANEATSRRKWITEAKEKMPSDPRDTEVQNIDWGDHAILKWTMRREMEAGLEEMRGVGRADLPQWRPDRQSMLRRRGTSRGSKSEMMLVSGNGGCSGMAPLHAAAISGNLEAAKRLIEYGADPTLRDVDGRTILHHVDRTVIQAVRTEEDHNVYKLAADMILSFGGISALENTKEEDDYGLRPCFYALSSSRSFSLTAPTKRYIREENDKDHLHRLKVMGPAAKSLGRPFQDFLERAMTCVRYLHIDPDSYRDGDGNSLLAWAVVEDLPGAVGRLVSRQQMTFSCKDCRLRLDMRGSTPLHLLAYQAQQPRYEGTREVFGAVRDFTPPSSVYVANGGGWTPFGLSLAMGSKHMALFRHSPMDPYRADAFSAARESSSMSGWAGSVRSEGEEGSADLFVDLTKDPGDRMSLMAQLIGFGARLSPSALQAFLRSAHHGGDRNWFQFIAGIHLLGSRGMSEPAAPRLEGLRGLQTDFEGGETPEKAMREADGMMRGVARLHAGMISSSLSSEKLEFSSVVLPEEGEGEPVPLSESEIDRSGWIRLEVMSREEVFVEKGDEDGQNACIEMSKALDEEAFRVMANKNGSAEKPFCSLRSALHYCRSAQRSASAARVRASSHARLEAKKHRSLQSELEEGEGYGETEDETEGLQGLEPWEIVEPTKCALLLRPLLEDHLEIEASAKDKKGASRPTFELCKKTELTTRGGYSKYSYVNDSAKFMSYVHMHIRPKEENQHLSEDPKSPPLEEDFSKKPLIVCSHTEESTGKEEVEEEWEKMAKWNRLQCLTQECRYETTLGSLQLPILKREQRNEALAWIHEQEKSNVINVTDTILTFKRSILVMSDLEVRGAPSACVLAKDSRIYLDRTKLSLCGQIAASKGILPVFTDEIFRRYVPFMLQSTLWSSFTLSESSVVRRSVFEDNASSAGGGGLFVVLSPGSIAAEGAGLIVEDSRFTGNQARVSGGALNVLTTSLATRSFNVNVSRTIFEDNAVREVLFHNTTLKKADTEGPLSSTSLVHLQSQSSGQIHSKGLSVVCRHGEEAFALHTMKSSSAGVAAACRRCEEPSFLLTRGQGKCYSGFFECYPECQRPLEASDRVKWILFCLCVALAWNVFFLLSTAAKEGVVKSLLFFTNAALLLQITKTQKPTKSIEDVEAASGLTSFLRLCTPEGFRAIHIIFFQLWKAVVFPFVLCTLLLFHGSFLTVWRNCVRGGETVEAAGDQPRASSREGAQKGGASVCDEEGESESRSGTREAKGFGGILFELLDTRYSRVYAISLETFYTDWLMLVASLMTCVSMPSEGLTSRASPGEEDDGMIGAEEGNEFVSVLWEQRTSVKSGHDWVAGTKGYLKLISATPNSAFP